MKKIRRCFAVLVLVISTFNSKAQTPATPIAFSNYIAGTNDTLYQMGLDWGKKLGEVYSSKDFSSLGFFRIRIQTFLERKKMEMLLMKDVKKSQQLRLAALEFLFFQDQLVEEGFKAIELLSTSSTDEAIKEKTESLSKLANLEDRFLKKLQFIQEKYAIENGFTISNTSEN